MKKIIILQKLFWVPVLIVCSTVFCAAQADYYPAADLNNKISRISNVTYLDLMRKIFPDAVIDETDKSLAHAAEKIPVRDLPGISPEKEVPNDRMEGELYMRVEGALKSRYENETIRWLIFSAVGEKYKKYVNSGHHILAVFRVKPTGAELIDAATVKKNDYVWFADSMTKPDMISSRAQLMIRPRREAVFIYTRATTNGGSPAFSLIELKENKVNVVLSEFDMWRDHECSYSIYETGRTRLLKSSTAGYRRLEITVATEKSNDKEGYPITDWQGRYRYVFAWNPESQSYKAVINPDKRRRAVLNRYDPCKDGPRE